MNPAGVEVLEELVALIEPEMERHWNRWGPENDRDVLSEVPKTAEGTYKYWQKRVERLRNVIRKRPTRLWILRPVSFSFCAVSATPRPQYAIIGMDKQSGKAA